MAAFTGTDLDALLRGFGVETIVLSGISTNIAPPGAATEAVAPGLQCRAGRRLHRRRDAREPRSSARASSRRC
jgi:hypothetical protein